MPWTNGPLVLYHGCDHASAASIITPTSPNQHGVQLAHSRPLTDFGRGFYTTTSFHQAKNWANSRCRRLKRTTTPWLATILRFEVDRNQLTPLAVAPNQLAPLEKLCFVIENSNADYWDLVRHCRRGGNHLLRGNRNYDVVFGLVSLWPQTLVVKDCDQISFHTSRGLSVLLNPSIAAQGTSSNPFLP